MSRPSTAALAQALGSEDAGGSQWKVAALGVSYQGEDSETWSLEDFWLEGRGQVGDWRGKWPGDAVGAC